MRRVAKEPVALDKRFPHQAEFAVFEIAQSAMNHARQRGAGAGTEIVFLDEHDIDALQRQLAKHAEAVDAAAEDADVHLRALAEPVKNLFSVHDGVRYLSM